MARKKHAEVHFDAIAIEGGLFPAEWLGKVAALEAPQQKDAYGVPKGLQLRDDLGRYWRIAQAIRGEFEAARKREDHEPAAVTRQFVRELLVQVFGFTDLNPAPLKEIAGRTYPVTLEAVGGRVPVVVGVHLRDLDKPDDLHGDGTRKRTAFGLLQDYLNASDDALWGMACNGRELRLARDNASLTRPAWISADLERIFAEERFADFSVLWLLVHASRFGRAGQQPQDAPLEQWRNAAREEGTRARDVLRDGVADALATLGQGFLTPVANQALRDRLARGELSRQDYFNQLLRLVYRMIFLLTVEERGLLHPPGTSSTVADIYAKGFSLRRLRERALRRSAHDRHPDLWESLKPVFAGLATGEPRLALPALGGLFAATQCPDLDHAQLENRALLAAVHRLAWLKEDSSLTRVNWRDMGAEEFGSVYESLLELTPEMSNDARSFAFLSRKDSAGNARKTTGSYYTPDELVQTLLDKAVEPIVCERIASFPEATDEAILSITVVDPACGSGHFILGAARRLATHLARQRTCGSPTPQDYRQALRDVVSHCIYGVDLNPMAVELCKVALWLETVEPGKPMGFLDTHVRCGNALVGVHDLNVLRQGIPGEAYAPLKNVLDGTEFAARHADDRDACISLKRRNAGEIRTPQLSLTGLNVSFPENIDGELKRLEEKEESLIDVQEKQRLLEGINAQGTSLWRLRMACDLWTAAFFEIKRVPKFVGQESAPTSDVVWRFLADPESLSEFSKRATDRLREEYRFFHWPLEFPEVFARGGFDLVLGNPPWETMSPDRKEFFTKHAPEIAGLSPEEQARCIEAFLAQDSVRDSWERHARDLYATVRFLKDSGRYRLFAEGNLGKGDFNVYRLFVELALSFARMDGISAQIVPENFYNGANASAIRAELFDHFDLKLVYGFENAREVWFKDIDTRMKFALYVARKGGRTKSFETSFSITSKELLQRAIGSPLSVPVSLVDEFSPDARAIMEFSNQIEIDIAKKIGSSPIRGEWG